MGQDFSLHSDHGSFSDQSVQTASTETSAWISELFDTSARGGSSGKSFSGGAIANIDLPANWTNGRHSENPTTGRKYDELFPKGASESSPRIQIYERGLDVGATAAANFSRLLGAPDHRLDDNELKSLGNVLDNKTRSSEFRIDQGWTETVNGKRVLFVEGEFLEDHKKSLSMIVDRDGTGAQTQELTYIAPSSKYDGKRSEALNSFKSISWR